MYDALKRIVEKLSRNIVFARRLPPEFGGGKIYVSPGAMLRYWLQGPGRVDPMLFRLATYCVKPGYTVWDVGANVGIFTFASAYLSGKYGHIVAIEADPWLVSIVRKTIDNISGDQAHVSSICAAVASRLGVLQFSIAERSRASSHIASVGGADTSGGTRSTVEVISITLDWLSENMPAPDVVKIDVEGAELIVFEGSTKILSVYRPVIITEVFNVNSDRMKDIVNEYDYVSVNAEEFPRTWEEMPRPAGNVLLIPSERKRQFLSLHAQWDNPKAELHP